MVGDSDRGRGDRFEGERAEKSSERARGLLRPRDRFDLTRVCQKRAREREKKRGGEKEEFGVQKESDDGAAGHEAGSVRRPKCSSKVHEHAFESPQKPTFDRRKDRHPGTGRCNDSTRGFIKIYNNTYVCTVHRIVCTVVQT